MKLIPARADLRHLNDIRKADKRLDKVEKQAAKDKAAADAKKGKS